VSSNKKHWVKLNSREIFRSKYIRFRSDQFALPDKRVMPNYYILDFPDWVNIVAVTRDKKILLIEQFRPPVNAVTLEIPGGTLDPHEGEDHEAAARRELEEETGYKAGSMKLLGGHQPNPAFQSNRLWTYLALDCEKVGTGQKLDEFEDIDVKEVSIEDAIQLSRDGSISHSLVIVAFHLALPELEKLL
jgi:ADP-ribose pyrophosphatase